MARKPIGCWATLVPRSNASENRPMVSQVAVLSDVHGVLPVLKAVLDEPDVAAADLIVLTGDHASGPQPVAVLDRLAALGERALQVRGNADRELVALLRGEEIKIPDEVTPWAAQQLRADQVELSSRAWTGSEAGTPRPTTPRRWPSARRR